MGNYIKGTFSVAAALSTMLTLGVGSMAFADADPVPPSTAECIAAEQALNDGQLLLDNRDDAATTLANARAEVAVLVKTYGIPFDVNTATAVDAESAISFLRGEREKLVVPDTDPKEIAEGQQDNYDKLSREMDVVKRLRDAINADHAALSAAAGVNINSLTSDKESACASTDEPTTTPEPGEGEQPPAGNDGGDDAAVDIQAQVDAAINEIRGFECDTTVGALEASGIFTDAYLRITTDLPLGVTSAQLGAISDAYLDRVAELNYCVDGGTTPPADVVDEATNGGTINAGNVTGGSNSQFESMPTIAPETGLL